MIQTFCQKIYTDILNAAGSRRRHLILTKVCLKKSLQFAYSPFYLKSINSDSPITLLKWPFIFSRRVKRMALKI